MSHSLPPHDPDDSDDVADQTTPNSDSVPTTDKARSCWSQQDVTIWLKRLLAGNPLYLVSAAMMLYGLHLVATDSSMLQQELSKLWFNVSAIEIYELMIVGVAVLLVRRRIWYDGNLLITLENMFMFVPFILISQATLFDDGNEAAPTEFAINDTNMWMVCGVVCLLAGVRFAALRKITIFRLPVSLVVFGMVLIVVNTAAPLWFRYVIAGDDSETWTQVSPLVWSMVLPVAVLIANLIPGLRGPADPLLSRRNWPLVLPLLWIVASAVHVRVIDYLDDVPFEVHLVAPLALALAWTGYFRTGDFTIVVSDRMKKGLLAAPLIAGLAAIGHDGHTLVLLMGINICVYGVLAYRNEQRSLTVQMAVASFAVVIGSMPGVLGGMLVPDFSREKIVILAHMAYLTYLFSICRDVRGTMGSIAMFGTGVAYLFDHLDAPGPYAIQAALLFGLIHSMFWPDKVTNARAVRFALAMALPAHAFFWGRVIDVGAGVPDINVGLHIALGGLLTIAVRSLVFGMASDWRRNLYMRSAIFTVLMVPVNGVISVLKVAPSGHLTVLGSFLVFAVATYVALNRSKWTIDRPETSGGMASNEIPTPK